MLEIEFILLISGLFVGLFSYKIIFENNVFGEKFLKSMQFWILSILWLISIIFLIIEIFTSFSFLEYVIGDLSKLEKSTIEIYLSLFVTILIGYFGIVAVVYSILYSGYLNPAQNRKKESKKLKPQIQIWFIFSIYFVIVMFVLFVYPLIEQLKN